MSPRPLASSEIQRILALVPWLVAHPGTTKPEIADRFGVSVDQLEDDLDLHRRETTRRSNTGWRAER